MGRVKSAAREGVAGLAGMAGGLFGMTSNNQMALGLAAGAD